jgi:hypothetical protein
MRKILLQFDGDPQPSSFDAIVAVDAGVDHLLQYSNVRPESVERLVHGAMFTRGGADLASTAIFIGGSDASASEQLLRAVEKSFFGPVRVSVLLDPNGCNTTAAAAVLSAGKHLSLGKSRIAVLGGSGPVGKAVARMLVHEGAHTLLLSRSMQRAQEAVESIVANSKGSGTLEPVCFSSIPARSASEGPDQLGLSANIEVNQLLEGCDGLIAAGAAGVQFVSTQELSELKSLRVAIDLNAVPPLGIDGIRSTDKAVARGERKDFGALGVGGLKMKIHRAAIQRLFTSNALVLDAEQVLELGRSLVG